MTGWANVITIISLNFNVKCLICNHRLHGINRIGEHTKLCFIFYPNVVDSFWQRANTKDITKIISI